jgi:hypothetical protein
MLRIWTAGLSIVMLGYIATLSGCASMDQKQTDVYLRESGGKLHYWKTVPEAAEIQWPYAWAALAAYQDSDDPKRKPLETTATCPASPVAAVER